MKAYHQNTKTCMCDGDKLWNESISGNDPSETQIRSTESSRLAFHAGLDVWLSTV